MSSQVRDTMVMGVVLIGMTAVGSMLAAPLAMLSLGGSSESAASRTAAQAKADAATNSPAFSLRMDWPDAQPPKTDPCDDLLKDFLGRNSAEDQNPVVIDGLIATLPDPVDSSSPYLFDIRLDVLRRAIATHGYSLDRFYLPWQPGNQGADKAPHHSEPGLLLFRRPSGKMTEALLLYLVGETPTAGIHKAAFTKAIDHLKGWRSDDAKAKSIRILAPTFTASGESLARAIAAGYKNYEVEGIKFRVVCGGANGIDWKRFRQLSNDHAEVYTTRPRASDLKSELLDFVVERDLPHRPIRIAWLVESTGYGRSFDRLNANQKLRRKESQTKVEPSSGGDSATPSAAEPTPRKCEIVEFGFPFHVSRIHSELQRQDSRSAKKPLHVQAIADSKLDLSNSETPHRSDVTPQFGATTPALDELQLRQMMRTISREGFRYVGIAATDPLDTAFLAGLVRNHCPNAQLLLIGASTSYLHPTQRQNLRGALVATGYSLHDETQHWTFPWGAGRNGENWMLTSEMDGATGVYNAAVLVLADNSDEPWTAASGSAGSTFQLADVKTSDNSESGGQRDLQLVDYGAPFKTNGKYLHPAVWISTIGHGEIVPLKVSTRLTAEDKNLVQIKRPPNDEYSQSAISVTFPLAGGVLITLLVLVSIIIAILAASLRRPHSAVDGLAQQPDPESPRLPTRWWPSLVDDLIPLVRPRSCDAGGWRLSPRGKQLLALFVPSLAVYCLSLWLAWQCLAVAAKELTVCLCKLTLAGLSVPLLAGICCLLACAYPPRRSQAHPRCAWPWQVWLTVVLLLAAAMYLYGFSIGLESVSNWSGWSFVFGFAATSGCAIFWLALCTSLIWRLRHSGGQRPGVVLCMFAGTTALAAPLIGFGLAWTRAEKTSGVWAIQFTQSMSLLNGISLVPATLCLIVVLTLWSGFVLRRLWLAEISRHELPPWCSPFPNHPPSSRGIPLVAISERMETTVDFIQEVLRTGCRSLRRNFTFQFTIGLASAWLWLAHLSRWSAASFDWPCITWSIWVIGGVAALTWLHTFWQAIVLRRMIHKLLRQIAWMPPLTKAMARLPERVRVVIGHFMDIRRRRPSYLRLRVQYATYLARKFADAKNANGSADVPDFARVDPALAKSSNPPTDVLELEKTFARELRDAPFAIDAQSHFREAPMKDTLATLAEFGHSVWLWLLDEWQRRHPNKLFPVDTPQGQELTQAISQHAAALKAGIAPAPGLIGGQPAPPCVTEDCLMAAEELVAAQVLNYLRSVLSFFYGLVWFLLGMTVLFVLAVLLWPMQPQRQLTATAICMLLAVTAFCVVALFAMERDRVHSILRGTTPDRVDFDRSVLIKLATALAPAAVLLSSYALPPSATQWFASIFEPFSSGY